MSYSVAQLKVDLQGMLHGTSLNKVTGVDELIMRAGRQLLLDVDPAETKRITPISNALYDQVYDYAAPVDLKGNKIIDVRPQVNRTTWDRFYQVYGRDFDEYKLDGNFTVQNNSGLKTIRISKDTIAGVLLNAVDSITGNGTWAVGGGASALAQDINNKIAGYASLSFSVTGATTSYIENSTMVQANLTTYKNAASAFVWVYMPAASEVTSVNLRWGSDSSNYYNRTVTASHFATAFQTGWNLLRFDWNGATPVGTPSDTLLDYARVSITHTASNTLYRVDSIMFNLPTLYEFVYYSNYLFQTAAGVWQATITADTNLVNLDVDSYNLLLDKAAEFAFLQMQDQGETADVKEAKERYQQNLRRYKAMYKSEVLMPKASYYRMPYFGRGRFFR